MGNHPRVGLHHRRRLLVVLGVISVASLTGVTGAASASHPTPVTVSDQPSMILREAASHSSLSPEVTCVDTSVKGQFTAYFGYTNSGSPVTIPTDSKFNKVSPSTYNGTQPSNFASGTVTNAFSVVVTAPSVSWTLGGGTASASSHSTQCSNSSLPVDPLGLTFVLTIGVGIALGVIVVTRTARRKSAS
jgi:hypothetical protein